MADRLTLEVATPSRLAVAEQACCAFFDFMVRVSGGELHLEVRGPQEAQEIISVLFGGCRRERIGAAQEGDVITSPARPTAPGRKQIQMLRETEPEGDSSNG